MKKVLFYKSVQGEIGAKIIRAIRKVCGISDLHVEPKYSIEFNNPFILASLIKEHENDAIVCVYRREISGFALQAAIETKIPFVVVMDKRKALLYRPDGEFTASDEIDET